MADAADAESALEPEWDSADSGDYQDGRKQAAADMAAGRHDDRAGSASRPWTEGYRDRHEEAADD